MSIKKSANLWALEDDQYFGLIVSMKTEIFWSNQTGGVACNHPKIEGLYVPLPLSWLKENPIENFVNSHQPFSATENAKIVSEFLRANPEASQRFEIDRKSKIRAQEAWLPVRVKKVKRESLDWDILAPFYGKSGILTYPNSD